MEAKPKCIKHCEKFLTNFHSMILNLSKTVYQHSKVWVWQDFLSVFERSLFCSTKLYLFDQIMQQKQRN